MKILFLLAITIPHDPNLDLAPPSELMVIVTSFCYRSSSSFALSFIVICCISFCFNSSADAMIASSVGFVAWFGASNCCLKFAVVIRMKWEVLIALMGVMLLGRASVVVVPFAWKHCSIGHVVVAAVSYDLIGEVVVS